jgi:flagellar hook-associated protein 1 FlgK
MSLTLGLNTALSGLLSSQRALDVISQNVVNVNTPGYTRKVMTLESRVVGGTGAGVQEASVSRSVDEGLLADIRRQVTSLGSLDALQEYNPRIEDLFGQTADGHSISGKVQSLQNAFEILGTDASQAAQQWSTVQSAQDVTSLLEQMTTQLQGLRLEADRAVEQTVDLVNEQLNNIADLNQKIVRNTAIGANAEDLKDKRDTALTTLAGYMDIQYFERSDGSMLVYSGSGRTLVDNVASQLGHASTTTTDPSLTLAAGNINTISLTNFTGDFGTEIKGGKLRALIDVRDTVIPNLQSNLDQMAMQIKDGINQVHNRGTVLPAVTNSMSGTRVFALQGDVVKAAGDNVATMYYNGGSTITAAAGGAGAGFTSLSFDNKDTTTPYLATITAANAGAFLGVFSAGSTFSMAGCSNTRNNGTYKVVAVDGTGTQLTVQKVDVRQTMKLTGTSDVMVGLYDTDGNQLAQSGLRAIMQTDYSANWTAADTARGTDDYEAKTSAGPWSINEVTSHVEQWLKAQGYTSASVALNSDGKLNIKVGPSAITGSTTTSLAFRDQASSTLGADAGDAAIDFDVDGDGTADKTVNGFSNFFGLNDFFTSSHENGIVDSDVMANTYKTTSTRTLRLLDAHGQIGNSMTIAAGSSLSDIAKQINNNTQMSQSVLLTSRTFTTTTNATFTLLDGNGNQVGSPSTFAAGSLSLEQIAGTLSSGNVVAQVVQDGSGWRLRAFDNRGQPLTVNISGGTVSGTTTTLGSTLSMTATKLVQADVVPEGSGYRLRIRDTEDRELYVAADKDPQSTSIITDLGLHTSATRMAGFIDVRTDIKSAPERISRGAVQWNADVGRYYMSTGDNTTALQLGQAMTSKANMSTAGAIYSGKYTYAEYAAATISVVASDVSHAKDQADYQTTLKQALDNQYTSFSGVNLDEEVANMINFQQAYSASAKVISTLQQMLEELVNIVR